MKKLFLLIAVISSMSVFAQVREPFAPAGSNWKYWFADEQTTGYVKVQVIRDDVPKTGVINGTEEEITVNCSELYSNRAFYVHNDQSVHEETPLEDITGDYKYMFKEGNKAYIFDKYNSTFYKLIDMDAQPGDQWEMSLFNGTYQYPWSHVEFYQDVDNGVPAEILPYYYYTSTLSITDENWMCYLDNPDFRQKLIDNGITEIQIEAWKVDSACVITGVVDAGDEHAYFTKATVLMDTKGVEWTDSTWACDLKYYDENVQKLGWQDMSYSEKNSIFALCDTKLNLLKEPSPMPEEIVALWDKMETIDKDDGLVVNYDFKMVTKHNWARYIDRYMETEMKKSVEDGGLGLTDSLIKVRYTDYFAHMYDTVPSPSDVDLIEVSEKKNVEINGIVIPVVVMSPACESLLDPTAFRSNLDIYGALNINYFNIYGESWPTLLEGGSTYIIKYFGLLCSDNGEYSIETPALSDYFEVALKNKFSAGDISCSEIEAPKFNVEDSTKSAMAFTGDNPFGIYSALNNSTLKSGAINSPDSVIVVNTVIHVVHNENNPEGKVSEIKLDSLLTAINEALMATNDQSNLNATFAGSVGNAAIELRLAITDPEGNSTTGVIYHETEVETFSLSGTTNEEKYEYKFNDIGMPYTWDHTKYLNIFIADFGTRDGNQIGGFVTNPEKTAENSDDFANWYANSDVSFWRTWLDEEASDAAVLDGLSLDYWSTFEADMHADLKYKTAIHELGHYFGLRHTFARITEVITGYYPWGAPMYSEVMNGDNLDDTPLQYYQTRVYDDCSRELFQCGNMVMINNFMDYSLPCACMYTIEQAEFMRSFTAELRSGVISMEERDKTGIQDNFAYELDVCPNPTTGTFKVIMNNDELFSVQTYTSTGSIVDITMNAYRETEISLDGLPIGVYLVRVHSQGKVLSYKIVKQ
ncbi:MAG: T9SS type A sorting domain-containing protein [Draconibacterium sp.]|nr:T9SS type A sorting domain-containing protein [Draconibacterium sp.]